MASTATDVEADAAPFVVLIAPNVAERMGGEAIKALQIYRSLAEAGVEVHQVTHARVRDELDANHPGLVVSYVDDDRLDRWLIRNKYLAFFTNHWFMWRASRIARRLVAGRPGAVVHYTSPISPVMPVFAVAGAPVVVGPQNGNIHHPAGFRHRESGLDRLRRQMMAPSQCLNRVFFAGKRRAEIILVAGGERTARALRIAGCRPDRFRPTLDSGLPDRLAELPLIEHAGPNFRFVQHGRLVPYKGADLSIRALAKTRNPATLDVVGTGPFGPELERLVAELGLADRVRFRGWTAHEQLLGELRQYRAFVCPSLAEANGIAVQEAMMLGLPTICVDWGGPADLITPESGIPIPPTDEPTVVEALARAMDRLGEDPALARSMAEAGRRLAIERGYGWSDLIGRWMAIYRELIAARRPAGAPVGAASDRG